MENSSVRESGDGPDSRYAPDMQSERHNVREALRSDVPAAHMGFALTVVVLAVIAGYSGLRWTFIVSGVFSGWFLLALAVIHIGSGRGWDAVRRAYVATFGWGNWI